MTSTTDLIDSAIWSLSLDDKIKVWELIDQLIKESQLPQQEISDEEIEDASLNIEHYNLDMIVIERIMWRKGAKWYKQQLKLKQ
jgi:hypothetical protein